jgi:hypothetical protein
MALTLDRIFYLYIAAAGFFFGLLFVHMTAAREFVIAPFFWIVLAIGLFEICNSFASRVSGAGVLTNRARVVGLCIGLAVMWAVTLYAGTPVRFV